MAETEMEAPRLSLLDVVQDRLQKHGKGPLLSRFVYIAKTTEKLNSREEIRAHHDGLLKAARGGDGEPVTGMMIVYPNSVLHVVEAQSKVVMEFLRGLKAADPARSKIKSLRIVSSTEDIPARIYNAHFSSFYNTPIADAYDATDPEQLVAGVSDINLTMLKLGKAMSNLTKMEAESWMDSIKSHFKEVPDVARVMGVAQSEAVPSLDDFLEIFDTPVDIDLDEESVWPMPAPLNF